MHYVFFFFQAEDGIRDFHVTGVQTCAFRSAPRRRTRRPPAVGVPGRRRGRAGARAPRAAAPRRRADRRTTVPAGSTPPAPAGLPRWPRPSAPPPRWPSRRRPPSARCRPRSTDPPPPEVVDTTEDAEPGRTVAQDPGTGSAITRKGDGPRRRARAERLAFPGEHLQRRGTGLPQRGHP